MTLPPRRMYEVDRFNPHAESPTCVEQGCVPAEESAILPSQMMHRPGALPRAVHVKTEYCAYFGCVPADAAIHQRLRVAAQAVVAASHEVYLVPHPAFEQAMQDLAAVLREGET